MQTPIIIEENGDFEFYDSVEAAEAYLEAVDVKNNEYVGYDSKGYLLKLTTYVERGTVLFFFLASYELVRIEAMTPPEDHEKELRLKLIDFFVECGMDRNSLTDLSLSEFVKLGQERGKNPS
jgi:hypothetical protein